MFFHQCHTGEVETQGCCMIQLGTARATNVFHSYRVQGIRHLVIEVGIPAVGWEVAAGSVMAGVGRRLVDC